MRELVIKGGRMREQLLESLKEEIKTLSEESLRTVIEYARALSAKQDGQDKNNKGDAFKVTLSL